MTSGARIAVVLLTAMLCGCGPNPTPAPQAQPSVPIPETPPAPVTYQEVVVAHAGTITGQVTAKPPAQAPRRLRMDRDPGPCGGTEIDAEDRVLSARGGLKWAVVRLDGIRRGKPLATLPPAAMDNHGCRFVPHVLLAAAGAPILFTNQDATLHTVDAYPRRNTLSLSLAYGTRELRTLSEPEGPINVECQLHKWMSGWLWVCEHPYYAVTDAEGAFTLTDVPPGDYTLKVWAEHAAREQSAAVHVGPDATISVTVAFTED